MKYDIVIVGLGGQGILTIGNIITQAALDNNIPAYFYPLKGMAQRGGFVKVQVRLGKKDPGPYIPAKGADLVISMERSESLKAIPYIRPGKEFLLYDQVWTPTAVMLGKEEYPSLDQVCQEIKKAKGKVLTINPDELPVYEDYPVSPNVYVIGSIMGHTGLGKLMNPDSTLSTIKNRWKKGVERNLFAFQSGMAAELSK